METDFNAVASVIGFGNMGVSSCSKHQTEFEGKAACPFSFSFEICTVCLGAETQSD